MIKPILFNTEIMVRSLLAGRKSVTRRIILPQPAARLAYICGGYKAGYWNYPDKNAWKSWGEKFRLPNVLPVGRRNRYWTPPYRSGDVLWVRETWHYEYRADCEDPNKWSNGSFAEWRPSIHMPKEAARLFLRVTDVRVERLQDITESQAEKEGCSAGRMAITEGPWGIEDDPDEWTARDDFSTLWDSTIKKADLPLYGWAANPWVWVIEFERISKEEAQT